MIENKFIRGFILLILTLNVLLLFTYITFTIEPTTFIVVLINLYVLVGVYKSSRGRNNG